MLSRNASSSGAPSSSTARIAAMRPRGDSGLEPGDAVRRAVRQAEAAPDARDELVLVDRAGSRRAGCARRSCRRSRLGGPDGRRPGASLPVGSNASRTRRMSRAFGSATPNPSSPGAPASRSSQPPASAAAARAAASSASSSAATCTVPTPTSASQRTPVASSAGASARSADGRTEIRPRCGPSGHAGAAATSGPVDGGPLGRDVGGDRPRAARGCGCRPTRCTTGGRCAAAPRTGRRRSRTIGDVSARGWHAQGDLHDHADGAERADEEAREVEAADVLDRGAAALHEAAVGGDEAHLEHAVAQRSVPQPAVPGEPGGEHPADGGRRIARVERALLAVLRRAPRRARSHGGAGADGDGEVGRVVGDDTARGARTSSRVGHRRAHRPPSACRAPTGHDGGRARDRGAQLVERRRPASIRSTRPRAPAGARRTGCPAAGSCAGSPAPTGRTRRAGGPAASRSSAREHQRHRVALLQADAVLTRQHATGGDARGEDLVAGAVHALPHARLAGVEHDQRVQVAVAGVEHVHHRELLLVRRSRTPGAARRRASCAGPPRRAGSSRARCGRSRRTPTCAPSTAARARRRRRRPAPCGRRAREPTRSTAATWCGDAVGPARRARPAAPRPASRG